VSAAPARLSDLALFRRLIAEARDCWLHLAGLLAVGLLATPLALLAPLPLQIAVDSALGQRPMPGPLGARWPAGGSGDDQAALWTAAILMVVIGVARQGQQMATRVIRSYATERLTLELRSRLLRHAQRLSFSHHDRVGVSDTVYRIVKDVPDAQSVLFESLYPSLFAGLTLIAMLVVTLRLDPVLALAALAMASPILLLNRHYRRQFRERWREVKVLESGAVGVIEEVLGALRMVKAAGQEEREHRRFVERAGEGTWARTRLTVAEGSFGLQVGAVVALGSAAVLFVGASHVRSGALTLGELLLLMGYLAQLYEPLKTLSRKTAGLQSKLAGCERVFALLDGVPDVVEPARPRPLHRARGRIIFDGVSFAYEPGRPAVAGLCLEVPAGARIGIAGPTGAGKSTLIALLLRFQDPTAGRVLLDGVDLREFRLRDLRRQFDVALQDTVLLSASIAENIAYAEPRASRARIVEAARAAAVHDFIARLPQGYDTPVGERGLMLSGGERQRLALARVFLGDAPVVLLDEPTSALDPRTEARVLEALIERKQGHTVLMVAHRRAAIAACERVLELDHGQAGAAMRA